MIRPSIIAQNAGRLVYGDTMVAETDEFLATRIARAMPRSEGGWTYQIEGGAVVPEHFTIDAATDALYSGAGGGARRFAIVPDLEVPNQFCEFQISTLSGITANVMGPMLRYSSGTRDNYLLYRTLDELRVARYKDFSQTFLSKMADTAIGVTYRLEVFGTNPVTIRCRAENGPWTTVEDSSPDRITTGNRGGFWRAGVSGDPDWKLVRWGQG